MKFLSDSSNKFLYVGFLFGLFCIIIFIGLTTMNVTAQSIIANPFESSQIRDFSFAAAGDFGCSATARNTVANISEKDPTLVIALGDLSYSKSADCWFDTISLLDTNGRLKISIGEHDLGNHLVLYNAYMNHFGLVKPFYSFNMGNVHFLAISTGKNRIIPCNTSSEQYLFVRDDLEKAHKDKDIDWIIVYGFRSFYSSLSAHPGLDELQEAYFPLFEKYGVDLVLQGHNHNYQRTYPLRYNTSSSSNPIVGDNELTNYEKSKGTIFLTVGTGGEGLYGFRAKAPFVANQLEKYGFLNVRITDKGNNLTGEFFENGVQDATDYFTITK